MKWVLMLSLLSVASVQSAGIAQGFYWQEQKQYTHQQRRSLVELLPKGSLYVHMPQILDTLALWNSSDLRQWQQTADFCKQRGVQLVIGLRTLYIDSLNYTLKRVQDKIKQLKLPFILGWDDCPGGLTEAQKKLQLQLVEKVSVRPWAIVPAAYYSQKGSISKWLIDLSIINDVDLSIPFILTSKNGINPSSLDPAADFPALKRKILFWDNWMAVDSLQRLPRNLPRNRSIKLFNSDLTYGYLLNLCFPPERIVHGIASIHYQQRGVDYDYQQLASVWTNYLLKHGFIDLSALAEMQTVLWELMYYRDGTMDVKQLLKQYPILSSFLYD